MVSGDCSHIPELVVIYKPWWRKKKYKELLFGVYDPYYLVQLIELFSPFLLFTDPAHHLQ